MTSAFRSFSDCIVNIFPDNHVVRFIHLSYIYSLTFKLFIEANRYIISRRKFRFKAFIISCTLECLDILFLPNIQILEKAAL